MVDGRTGSYRHGARPALPGTAIAGIRQHPWPQESAASSSGNTLNRSPTSPMSAISKIGASPSLLMATIVPASLMPVRCWRSEEHTSELQSLMRISYAVFCLKKKKNTQHITHNNKLYYYTKK